MKKEETHITIDEIWDFLNHKMGIRRKAKFTFHLYLCKECLNLTLQQQKIKEAMLGILQKMAAGESVPEELHQPNPVIIHLKGLIESVTRWTQSGKIIYKDNIEQVDAAFKNLIPLLQENWNRFYFRISDVIGPIQHYPDQQLLLQTQPISRAGARLDKLRFSRELDLGTTLGKSLDIISNLNEDEFIISIKDKDGKKTILVKTKNNKSKERKIVLIGCRKELVQKIEKTDYNPFLIIEGELKEKGSFLVSEFQIPDNEYQYIIHMTKEDTK